MSEFLRSEWDVLLGMLGISLLAVGLLTWLFSLSGSNWIAVLANPIAILGVVGLIAIECAVVWWSSRD